MNVKEKSQQQKSDSNQFNTTRSYNSYQSDFQLNLQPEIEKLMKIKGQHSYMEQFIKLEQQIKKDIKLKLMVNENDSHKNNSSKLGKNYIMNFKNTDTVYDFGNQQQEIQKEQPQIFLWDNNFLLLTKKQQEVQTGMELFTQTNYLQNLKIDKQKFSNFLNQLQNRYNYRNNPFHNFQHALTVTHGVVFMMQQKVICDYLDDVGQFALMLAALCHDTDHPATNNQFQVASMSKLALKYSDVSVLEQHHLHQAFKLLLKRNCIFLDKMNRPNFQQIRSIMIAGILATDMKQHFLLQENFANSYQSFVTGPEIFMQSQRDKDLLAGFIVHTCDFSGSAKKYDVSSQWAKRVCQEFTGQVSLEEKMNLTVTQHMQNLNDKETMAKQEVSFLSFIVLPNWQLANKFFQQKLQAQVNNLKKNIEEWNIKKEEAILEKSKQ